MARGALIQARTLARSGESPVSQDEVAQVAFQLFERRGRTHGRDQQDWFEAERIVRQRRSNGKRS